MNTKALMVLSSLFLGLAGLVASFAPSELVAALGAQPTEPVPVLVQLLGALYLGFAMANWTAKGQIIGGIYSRALTIGNCVHFVVGALAIGKYESARGFRLPLTAALVAYGLFALCFGYLVFGRGSACKTSVTDQPKT